MRVEKETKLEIFEDGVIQVAIDDVYFKDGNIELTRERHRYTLLPGDYVQSYEILDEYHMSICKTVWTQEVIDKYNEKLEIQNEQAKYTQAPMLL